MGSDDDRKPSPSPLRGQGLAFFSAKRELCSSPVPAFARDFRLIYLSREGSGRGWRGALEVSTDRSSDLVAQGPS